MFEDLDDPKKQMMLALAMGLLGGQGGKGLGGFGRDLGQAGLLGMNQYAQAKQGQQRALSQKQDQEMRAMQMAEMQRGNQFNEALRGGYQPPVTPSTPMDDNGNRMPSSPEGIDFSKAMQVDPVRAMQMKKSLTPQPKMAFAPNGQVVDMNSLAPGNYAPPEKLPELIRYQQLANDPTQPESVRKVAQAYIAKATTHAPSANVTTNVMPPREVFKDSLGLKKDFDSQPEVKGFKEVQGAWDQIETALKNPSAANDLAAATKFMKLLDPGSVVRESELMMAMQASGVLDRFANYHNLLLKGQKLTPNQREDFYKSGQALYEASKDRFGQTIQQYEGIADQYGLDKRFIEKSKPRKASGWSIQRVP